MTTQLRVAAAWLRPWVAARGAATVMLVSVAAGAGAQPARSPAKAVGAQADSAAVARAAYRRAIAAYRSGDLATARAAMVVAADSWPTQQAYLEGAARLAAAALDTAGVVAWLDRLTMLGVGPSVTTDTVYRGFVGNPRFDSAAARLRRATAPVVRGSVRLVVGDTLFHPEGLAFDQRTGQWFVSSVRQRRIVRVRDGVVTDLVGDREGRLAGMFGMTVDTVRRTLWAATTALPRMTGFVAADGGRAGVVGVDVDSGRLVRQAWLLPRDGAAHTFGDVAVGPAGEVYVSDSESPWIFRVPARGDTLERFLTHPLFRSLQGMAITPDGATMFVADYSHGLLRVDLRRRSVNALRVAPRVTTLGIDGLYLHGRDLVAIQNGVSPMRVVRFCLDRSGEAVERADIIDRNPVLADEPTLGSVVGDSLFYVATSQWETFDDAGRRRPGTIARPVTIVGVPLDSSASGTSRRDCGAATRDPRVR